MDEPDRRRFDILTRLLDACEAADLPLADQLDALAIVWTERAQRLRGDCLAEPGAFPREQARQHARLARMAVAINEAADLEYERLVQEDDRAGLWDYVRRTLRDGAGIMPATERDALTALDAIAASETNFAIDTVASTGFGVRLGDDMNGFKDETRGLATIADVVAWLDAAILRYFPDSEYARALRGQSGVG